MENVCKIIKKHSNYVSRKKPELTPSCNCRKKDDCPMNNNCLINNVIYKCTVSPPPTTKQRAYLGLAEGEWKQRYYNHTQPFRNAIHKNDTALSRYLWKLKKKTSEIPKLIWSILKIVPGYSKISKRRLLCLDGKLYIATYHNSGELLNKRSELISKCCHENKFLFSQL